MFQIEIRTGRLLAAATVLGAFLAAIPMQDSRADSPAEASASTHAKPPADHSEARIKELHAKLQITAAEEALWGDVAQAMRDNGKAFRIALADRAGRSKDISAVDDLKSFQTIADQHAEGLKRLIPVFEALYASMPPTQQKRADQVFGEHERHAHM